MKNLMISVLLCLSIPACKVTAWEDKTDNAFWEDGIGSCENAPWTPLYDADIGYYVELNVIGSWVAGYRPSKIRVTYTGGTTVEMGLKGADPSYIAQSLSYTSGAEANTSFAINDIFTLLVGNKYPDQTYFEITKIEFGFNIDKGFAGSQSILSGAGGLR